MQETAAASAGEVPNPNAECHDAVDLVRGIAEKTTAEHCSMSGKTERFESRVILCRHLLQLVLEAAVLIRLHEQVDFLALLPRPESGDPAGRRVLLADHAHGLMNDSHEGILRSLLHFSCPRTQRGRGRGCPAPAGRQQHPLIWSRVDTSRPSASDAEERLPGRIGAVGQVLKTAFWTPSPLERVQSEYWNFGLLSPIEPLRP